MNKITGYLMAPVRGRDGDDVLPEVKWANVQKAIEIGNTLRAAFPCLDLYVPHESETIIDQLWQNGLSSDKITDATAQIAVCKNVSFVFEGNGISEGMAKEIKAVRDVDKAIIYFTEITEKTKAEIAYGLSQLNVYQEAAGE